MATKRASLIIAVDGGAQFKQELANATKETRLYKQELESVQETYKDNANSITALEEKQKSLIKLQESYVKQLEAAKAGHQHAVQEYERQSAAVDKLSDQLDKAKKALDDYQKGGGSDSAMTRSLQANVDEVSAALEKQRLNLAKAEGKVTDWQKAQVKAASDLNNINKQIDKNEDYLDEASKSADKCAKSIDKYGNEADQAADDVKDLNKQSSTMTDVLKGMIGADFITSGIRAVADAAKEAIEYVIGVGSEYEAAMSKVEALSGATGSELEALDQKARELGASTQYSASEVAEAMSSMALAGWSTKEMLDGIDGVLYLAAAGQMDLANASDAVAGYLAAFNMEASESARLADIMATAQAKSKTTADQLSEAYSTSATNLTQYGQDVTTTTALLEAMASVNDTGSAAGTKLNAVMAQVVQKMKDGAISIGDTSVAVKDANGDFRSMIDILADIEQATNGMADADKAAALQKTFNRTALSGLNELLAVGSDQLREYQGDLENCDGAAEKMANTMNDNLKGDLTELSSATEGLGIAAYNAFQGPMREGVQILTSAVSGLTSILDQPKDKFQTMVDSMKSANDELKTSISNIDADFSGAETDANRVAILVAQLKNLNAEQQAGAGTEAEALSRKMQMQAIIDELGGTIPEIAEAWNAETGELSLNNDELSTMIENYKQLAVQQAAMNAMQEVTNSLVEANIALQEGQANADYLEKRKAALEGLKTTWEQLNNEYNQHPDEWFKEKDVQAQKVQIEALNSALKQNLITTEEYDELIKNVGVGQFENGLFDLNQILGKTTDQLEDQTDAIDEQQKLVQEAQDKYDEYGNIVTSATERLTKSQEDATDSTEDSTSAVQTFSLEAEQTAETVTGAYEDMAEAAEGEAETEEMTAEQMEEVMERKRKAAEDAAQAQQEAAKAAAQAEAELSEITRTEADKVVETLEEIREEARKTVETDFFGEFDGGTDESIDVMLERSKENILALQEYQNNLKEVSAHVGQEIAPEFLAYLESLGTDGANMLQNITLAFEQDGGAEKVKEWSDNYLQTLNLQDSTADILAGDKIALQDGLSALASTDVEFDTLRQNIDLAVTHGLEGWDALTDGTRQKLNDTISICQQIGVKIPDGLASGILSGKTSPDAAINELNASISGRFDGLLADAQAQGLEITQSISDGMDEGGEALITAYAELIALITQSRTDAETEANEKGANIGSEIGAGIGSATSDAETGAQTLSGAAISALQGEADSFTTEGQNSAKNYANGLAAGSSTVNSAAKALAATAKSAISSHNGEYIDVGKQIDNGIAQGIYSGSSYVTTAAQTVAYNALKAAKAALEIQSPSKVFRDEVGLMIPEGIAEGIEYGGRFAEMAMMSLSHSLSSASSEWLTQRKREQDVAIRDEANYWKALADAAEYGSGAYLTAMMKYNSANNQANQDNAKLQSTVSNYAAQGFGVSRTKTEGSGDDAKTVLKDVESYYGEVYSAAQNWLNNWKSVSAVAADQEVIFWRTVANSMEVGTDAWYDASSNLRKAEQQMVKDAETYKDAAVRVVEEQVRAFDEAQRKIVNQAEDYIRKRRILYGMSTEEELQYWQNTIDQLVMYSDAWYDVLEKINNLKIQVQEEAERAQEEAIRAQEEKLRNHADMQSKLISDYKVYYKVSLRAEMDYWNQARKQFESGTEERIAADEKYFSAKEAYYDELERLDKQYQSDYEAIQEKMQNKINDLTDAYKNAVTQREESILSSMNLFEYWDSEGVTGKELLDNLASQVEGLERYTIVLESLKDRGILDQSLIDELEAMGPDAGANIAGLASLTDKELRKYNELYLQRQELAHQQALTDNKELLNETINNIRQAQREASDELSELTEVFQDNLAEVQAVLDPALQHWLTLIGAYETNFFTGIDSNIDYLVDSPLRERTKAQVKGVADTIKAEFEGLEGAFPEIGKNALTALLETMTDRERIRNATTTMIDTIKEELLNANGLMDIGVPFFDFAALNNSVSVNDTQKIQIENSEIINALTKAISAIETMATALDGAQVVLDTGETIGVLETALSQAQAEEYLVYNRGRI